MVRAMNVKMSDSYADLGPSRNEVEELRLSELRHRFLAESASDVVWSMGLDGTVTYVSPAVENVLGYTAEETMQMSFDELLLPDSKAKVDGDLSRLRADMAAGRPPQGFRSDLKQRKKDGSIIWTEVIAYPLTGSDGSLVEIVGVTRDICARKKYEHELEEAREAAEAAIDALASVNAKLRRLATTDDLTGAANRRRLEDAVEAELARARRTGQPVALIMFVSITSSASTTASAIRSATEHWSSSLISLACICAPSTFLPAGAARNSSSWRRIATVPPR